MSFPGIAEPAVRNSASRLRIVVLGYLVRGPLGGLAWHHLQYVMGLARLGHQVLFAEDSDDYPSCYNPLTNLTEVDPAYGLKFADQVFDRVGLKDCWCYHDAHGGNWYGPAAGRIRETCHTADMLIDLSGVNPVHPWMVEIPVRVLIDTDPVFTQIRHLSDTRARDRALLHNRFFTFGENFGMSHCTIPDDGFQWLPTRQPVVLEAWPVTPGVADGKITAVMQWKSYHDAVYQGVSYGMKSASFPPYRDLPARVGKIFELALGSRSSRDAALEKFGWKLVDPHIPTKDPWTYQRYIQQSRAEFGVAKHGYVTTHSGWFSERSTSYLASGRPVLVQETGFSQWLSAGDGVLPFSSPEDVIGALDDLNTRYDHHCRAAREVVHAHFSAITVLTNLVEQAMNHTAAVGFRKPIPDVAKEASNEPPS